MALSVISDKGSPVDWFFMYKLPKGAKGTSDKIKEKSTGHEYLYYDSTSKGTPKLSSHEITDKTSALEATIQQLQGKSAGLGYVMYNDETPGGKVSEKFGHTKGVLTFDVIQKKAFWLLHSTPKYPHEKKPDFPVSGIENGQTFLCLQLDSLDTLEKIAAIMCEQQQPQVYAAKFPKGLSDKSALRTLENNVDTNSKDNPVRLQFKSAKGEQFNLFAKNPHWNDGLWRDFVTEELKIDLVVETWRRLKLDENKDGSNKSDDGKEEVEDVQYMDFSHIGIDYMWRYTKDHSKFATSEKPDWVFVGDINRDKSQRARGGGAIGFQNKDLWQALINSEILTDTAPDKTKAY